MDIQDAVKFIQKHEFFTLMGHISSDGDTLGCTLALHLGLGYLGKHSRVVFEEDVPSKYAFLPGADDILKPADVQKADIVISVDCADKKRLGLSCAMLFDKAEHTLCIDHHPTNSGFAKTNVILMRSSCGEIMVDLLKALNVPISRDIGTCLYTAISTDTGNFSYDGVTKDTFEKMADVMDSGFDLYETNRKIFRSEPMRKVRIRSYILDKMESLCDGRITIAHVSRAEYTSFGGNAEDLEGIIDSLRDIEKVELSALIHEAVDGSLRVSFRSIGDLDVSTLAKKHLGGGHAHAAGCTLHMEMDEAVDLLKEELTDLLMWEKEV